MNNLIMDRPKHRTIMKRHPCNPENSILVGDIELAVLQKTLQKIKVMETPEGYYVVVQLKWAKKKEWYLTTRRNRSAPKIFKDIKRLNDHLRSISPTDNIEIFRNQKLPQSQ